jgi:hypothetical protein
MGDRSSTVGPLLLTCCGQEARTQIPLLLLNLSSCWSLAHALFLSPCLEASHRGGGGAGAGKTIGLFFF